MAEDSKLVPPFAERRSQICESSAVRRRTQNLRALALKFNLRLNFNATGGEFSHKNSIVRVPCPPGRGTRSQICESSAVRGRTQNLRALAFKFNLRLNLNATGNRRTFSSDSLVPAPGGRDLGKVRPTGSYPPGRARRV